MICKSKSILLLLCLVPLIAFAQHTMERVWIQVHINHDGSARVKEIRVARVSEGGTEGYITFNKMGDMELRDISVRDDHGLGAGSPISFSEYFCAAGMFCSIISHVTIPRKASISSEWS